MALDTLSEIVAHPREAGSLRGDLLVLPLLKGSTEVPGDLAGLLGRGGPLQHLLDSGDFKGDLNKTAIVYGAAEAFTRILVLGLGDAAALDGEKLRQAVATAARVGRDLSCKEMIFPLPVPGLSSLSPIAQAEIATEAALLGTYEFDAAKAKSEPERRLGRLVLALPPQSDPAEAERAVVRGKVRARGTNVARDLAHTPANLMTPTHLADRARVLGAESGLEVRVIEREEAERLGMGAFLGVAQGSDQPPKFIVLEYRVDSSAPTVGLVGKGITFDTGGISLKPGLKMDEMKYDMCGAASVLGAMSSLRDLDVKVNVVGAIPATENMPGPAATKPGDVHTSFSGKTIEVLNTDAEGRLVLADGLSYVARQYQPDALIDIATLTGAVIIALGHYGAAVLSNDDDLCERIRAASARSGERTWRLPIWEEYPEHMKTPFADIKNIADGNAGAGTIAGGAFLAEFAEGRAWAHLDIAGTAWWDRDRPHIPKGASGYGVRLLIDLIETYAPR